jgi:hypothetical protein
MLVWGEKVSSQRLSQMLSINTNQHKRCINAYIILLLVAMLVACSDQQENKIEVGAEESQGGFSLPQNLQASALPANGQIKAYFIVDNNPRVPMQFDGEMAHITIPKLNSGPHVFRIEFEFDYTEESVEPLMLAAADTQLALKAGTNKLDFDGVYVYPDSDDDSIENFKELENGTDPRDSACLFGQVWNGCTPAATPDAV